MSKQFPSEQLESLIKAEKWDELGVVLKDWVEDQPEGSDKLDAIRAYIKLKINLTEQYNEKLDMLIAQAEEVLKTKN